MAEGQTLAWHPQEATVKFNRKPTMRKQRKSSTHDENTRFQKKKVEVGEAAGGMGSSILPSSSCQDSCEIFVCVKVVRCTRALVINCCGRNS